MKSGVTTRVKPTPRTMPQQTRQARRGEAAKSTSGTTTMMMTVRGQSGAKDRTGAAETLGICLLVVASDER